MRPMLTQDFATPKERAARFAVRRTARAKRLLGRAARWKHV
jgi:hypothetical protein